MVTNFIIKSVKYFAKRDIIKNKNIITRRLTPLHYVPLGLAEARRLCWPTENLDPQGLPLLNSMRSCLAEDGDGKTSEK